MDTRRYTTITVERNESFKKFVEICKKNGLKKKVVFNRLIEEFVKNPQKFLFNN